MAITRAQLKKFSLLSSLYIAQGLPFGFFTQALPALLREKGISLEIIGLGSLLALPWAFKWLWAPLLDRTHHHRRWILSSNLCAVLTCLLLASFDLEQLVQAKLWLLYLGFFILNLSAATQDIATDAMAVIQLSENERGIGNGIQVAGYRLGMILSGGALLSWFSVLGWQSSILILATLLALASLPIILFPPSLPKTSPNEQFGARQSFWLLTNPHGRMWLLTLCLYKFGEACAVPMLRPMLIDQGRSLQDLAYLIGTVGFAAGLFGSLTGGIVLNHLGQRLSLRIFLLLNAGAIFAFALIAQLSHASQLSLQVVCALEHFTAGMATVALFSEMMYHCRPQHEATDYTMQACLVVLMTILGAAISGFLAKALGYAGLFFLCAGFTLAVMPVLITYQKKRHLLNQSVTR